MKNLGRLIPLVFFVSLLVLFFYKFFFSGLIPFPGDLLVAEYNPWKSYSYLGYNPGSFPNKAQYFDVLRQLYPWKTFVLNQVAAQQFPLWNPYNFSGSPLFANIQSAVLYPLNIFYFFLPQPFAWTLLVMLQVFLSGIFSYLFIRSLRVSKISSLLSSTAFACSLYTTVFLEYNSVVQTLLWMPLALYGVQKINEAGHTRYYLLLTLAITLLFFAGHLQVAVASLLFIICFVVFSVRSFSQPKRQRVLLLYALFGLIALGIAAVQLIPSLELILNSARVPQEYPFLIEKLLIQPSQLLLFVAPDLFGNPATRNYLLSETYPTKAVYIGFLPFVFFIFSLVLWKTNNYVKFFGGAILVLLLLLVRTPLSELFYRVPIPFFSTSSPSNTIFLLSFCISVLAGFGLDVFLQKNKKYFLYISIIVFSIIGCSLLIFKITQTPFLMSNALFSLGLAAIGVGLFFLGSVFSSKKQIIALFFLLITIADLFYFFQKFNPFVPQAFMYPKTPVTSWLTQNAGIQRVWGYGAAALEANTETHMHIFSPNGYDPIYPKRYGAFIQSSKEGKIATTFTNQTRSDAVIAPGYGERDLILNEYRLRVLDMVGVTYILDKPQVKDNTFPKERFKQVYTNNGWHIFQNLNAVPRVFLAEKYEVFSTDRQFEQLFFAKNFNPAKVILLEEKPAGVKNTVNDSSGSATISLYSPNKVVIKTKTKTNQLLFLSDTYFPGWKALVDNKETKIYRANYTFRAVVAPKGEHMLTFVYEPESFYWGIKTTIISLVVLGGVLLMRVRKKNEK